MNVFDLRRTLVERFAEYTTSQVLIRDERIRAHVEDELRAGVLYPDALVQLNPRFRYGRRIHALVDEGLLAPGCRRLPDFPLYRHQEEAVRCALRSEHYVLTTGTGSGKSLTYLLPIIETVLREGSGKGIRAILVYPMNALVNSQQQALEGLLVERGIPVTFARYTGQETGEVRQEIQQTPPDILLTNYVMLELLLTRPEEHRHLIRRAQGLRFLVLDELHTYRGRQGADVAYLLRRLRAYVGSERLTCVGTSATLATEGSLAEQRRAVAALASDIFAEEVKPENVIGETLERVTEPPGDGFAEALRRAVASDDLPETYEALRRHALMQWIEDAIGLRRVEDTYVRATPRRIRGEEGLAEQLAAETGLDVDRCEQRIRNALLRGNDLTYPGNDLAPVFAFRLHQFFGGGKEAYASLEPAGERFITLEGQQYVPGSGREKRLYPLKFCRNCGREYYQVKLVVGGGSRTVQPLDVGTEDIEEEPVPGYLYLNTPDQEDRWCFEDEGDILSRMPDAYLTYDRNGRLIIASHHKNKLPQQMGVRPDGTVAPDGIEVAFIPERLHFCLSCGAEYPPRVSDRAKLMGIGETGRSSATTLISLYQIVEARHGADPDPRYEKLLSFTDNRQDASLQAGHFNDFVHVGLIRGALASALERHRELTHENLAEAVLDAMGIPFGEYSASPDAVYTLRAGIDATMRDVLAYRVYQDVRRGWRFNSPNLEQTGLLHFDYLSLEEISRDEALWADAPDLLRHAEGDRRREILHVVLDYLRVELAVNAPQLDPNRQEKIREQSQQRLVDPWSIEENETLIPARLAVLGPGSGTLRRETANFLFISERGRLGKFFKRPDVLAGRRVTDEEVRDVLWHLFEIGVLTGLIERRELRIRKDPLTVYQLNADVLRWRYGAGDENWLLARPHIVRRSSPFFQRFYREDALRTRTLRAAEHTAQVRGEVRIEREDLFREGQLPILYCSPTMELGIDIAELNAVNLRNVPPTPANYAQRSGRAGRSGQPALVTVFCSARSPHDQYFFYRPDLMVSGTVAPPRIDLTNEDLVRAHVHAIWLTESDIDLGSTLKDVLDLEQEGLPLRESLRMNMSHPTLRDRTFQRCRAVLESAWDDLLETDWFDENWLRRVVEQAPQAFDRACDRWRTLYLSAQQQMGENDRRARDPSLAPRERETAKSMWLMAKRQLDLLISEENVRFSDFYVYRYFATEGFLPGYSFPRLPLSAYIPGRRGKKGNLEADEFINRPRFIAISEFAPESIIYHEGVQYQVDRVIMPPLSDGQFTEAIQMCQVCGYVVPPSEQADHCPGCAALLPLPKEGLFRMQNVVTRSRQRITSDEEERRRTGYELRTLVHFATTNGKPRFTEAAFQAREDLTFNLRYAPTADIWRVNLGWKKELEAGKVEGFYLDTHRGKWLRSLAENNRDDPDRYLRVIPYVKDTRNSLLLRPDADLTITEMTSLKEAVRQGILLAFQLEETELAAEPLPTPGERRQILFYEASEGGAGVLRHLVSSPEDWRRVLRHALEITHFDPDTGEDLRRAKGMKEDCEAACYHCLLSYRNQRDHALLDRHAAKPLLLDMLNALDQAETLVQVRRSGDVDADLEALLEQGDSELERKWLRLVHRLGLRLPDKAQKYLDLDETCRSRVDFWYGDPLYVAVYIDGPIHDAGDIEREDEALTACLQARGITVLRFRYDDDWKALLRAHEDLFGAMREDI
ncbi:DEAD/DEAH box helicase [Rhodocaloribacter sp.]